MKKLFRYALWTSLVGLLVIAVIVLGCNYCVTQYARHWSFSEVDSVPFTGVGLLLGVTPQTRIGKERNLPAADPIAEPAIETYMEEQDTFSHDINTIDAHDEQDTIVGNFTGQGMDTLFVETVYKDELGTEESVEYFMRSTNRRIPKLRLYGCLAASPKLVNEGDLDGNGTCEVGYLHTWMMSQWRYYRIFTLVNNEWRYLLKGDYLDTSEWFRHAGVEVAEPGKTKGTILIHYPYEGYDPQKDSWVNDVRDTIVTPTFSKIDD